MLRIFSIVFIAVITLVVGVLGFRGEKFSEPPRRLFPDMDEMDYVDAQTNSSYFADGMGARIPVAGTQPRGFENGGDVQFSGDATYYTSGAIGDYFGNGLPEELELDKESVVALVNRGKERYAIYCAVCHGEGADGKGIVTNYQFPNVANLLESRFASNTYPDGQLFNVISEGKGLMSGYAYNIPVKDRWAIIAYIRSLQAAK